MTAFLSELVAIESPSTDPAGVAALARRIDAELSPLGLSGELVPVEGAGPDPASAVTVREDRFCSAISTPSGTSARSPAARSASRATASTGPAPTT